MSLSRIDSLDVFRLEDTVWVASQAIGAPLYDFAFERFFACRRPWERPSLITAIGRFGAAADYQDVYARLRPVAGAAGIGVPPSFEFRSFWLSGELVGAGPYWTGGTRYDWTATERAEGLALAREVAATLHVPFLVVDLAQLETGEWIVVECNDAQEAGYAGISPFALWARVLEASRNAARERQKSGA